MMTGRGGGQPAADGGLARHIPVLGGPAVEFLNVRDGGVYIDATFGAGGYTRAILGAANCNVIGIDRDQQAIANGFDLVSRAEGRLVLIEDRFSHLEDVARSCGYDAVDGAFSTIFGGATLSYFQVWAYQVARGTVGVGDPLDFSKRLDNRWAIEIDQPV
jgi:hypothetical protein